MTGTDMSEPETVELRRYPSRKLYNKNASSYVRLPEVAEMVRKGANIRVEDTETGEDVTRQVLLQIIMEQEGKAAGAMLSADLMMDMIRLHQSKASEMMTGLFEQSVAFIRTQQEQLASQMTGAMSGASPAVERVRSGGDAGDAARIPEAPRQLLGREPMPGMGPGSRPPAAAPRARPARAARSSRRSAKMPPSWRRCARGLEELENDKRSRQK